MHIDGTMAKCTSGRAAWRSRHPGSRVGVDTTRHCRAVRELTRHSCGESVSISTVALLALWAVCVSPVRSPAYRNRFVQ